jgi:hypothetical protein
MILRDSMRINFWNYFSNLVNDRPITREQSRFFWKYFSQLELYDMIITKSK